MVVHELLMFLRSYFSNLISFFSWGAKGVHGHHLLVPNFNVGHQQRDCSATTKFRVKASQASDSLFIYLFCCNIPHNLLYTPNNNLIP